MSAREYFLGQFRKTGTPGIVMAIALEVGYRTALANGVVESREGYIDELVAQWFFCDEEGA